MRAERVGWFYYLMNNNEEKNNKEKKLIQIAAEGSGLHKKVLFTSQCSCQNGSFGLRLKPHFINALWVQSTFLFHLQQSCTVEITLLAIISLR